MESTTNKGQIYIIVCTICILAATCVGTQNWLAVHGIEPPRSLDLLTGGLVGAITGMLVKTSPTETTKQVAVQDQPVVVPADEPTKP